LRKVLAARTTTNASTKAAIDHRSFLTMAVGTAIS
jgi:hypothetical protein